MVSPKPVLSPLILTQDGLSQENHIRRGFGFAATRFNSGDTPLPEPVALRLVQARGPQLESDFSYSTFCHFEDQQRCAAQRHLYPGCKPPLPLRPK